LQPEDLLGKHDYEIIPGAIKSAEKFSSESPAQGKVSYPGKNGRHLHFTKSPIRDKSGQILGTLCITTTPEGHRLLELRQSELEFRRVWDHSFDGMRLMDMDGIVLMVNEAFCRLVEKDREDLVGKHFSVIYALEDQVEVTERHKQRCQSCEFDSISEREHQMWNGKQSCFELSNSIIEIEDQTPQILSIFRDVTERRRDEEQLRDFMARLERSNGELQDFAYVASHDLQEPLRKVTVFGDRLNTRFGSALGEEGKDYLERMLKAARRMQSLINDLLTFSRITRKATPFVPVDLKKAALEVLDDLEARIEQVGATVEVGDLPTIEAEPLQMRQLFQNLIGNALKFHRPGIKPLIKVESRKIQVTGAHGERTPMLQVSVSDNGIGFEEKYATRIFQVFQRLHTREVYEGTGMGLAITRKISEYHGGSIQAKSTLGEGSTFIITLPLCRKSQPKTQSLTTT
jgi:two-component system, LuxR family, sensor kinase FixL